jgi:hypothetical protein
MVSPQSQTIITRFVHGQGHRRRGDACGTETSEQGPRRSSYFVNLRTLARIFLLHHINARYQPSKMIQLSRRQMPVVSSRARLVSTYLEVC